jgi:4-amino-4-deoxy-L-arabinose transferase-like glycosyltransferase
MRLSRTDPGHANTHSERILASHSPPRYLPYFVLLFALLFVFVVRVNLIGIPFERDEGLYNYFGLLVLEGKTPYLDFYELKPPGIFYAYALLNLIFGSTLERSHFAFMVINLLTVVLLFLAGKRLLDDLSGAIVAASYGILALGPQVSGFTTQSEHLVAFFVSAGMLALTVSFRSKSSLPFFLSGFLFGLSMTIKQTGLFFVLFGGLTAIGYHLLNRPVYAKVAIRDVGAYCAGVLLVGSLMGLMIVGQGAFKEFLYWTYDYPKFYASQVTPSEGWTRFRLFLARITENYLYLWISAGTGLFLGSVIRWDNYKKAFIWMLAIFSFFAICPGLRFFWHYWIQLLPAVSLLVGVAFYAVKNMAARMTWRVNSSYVSLGLFLVFILPIFLSEKEYYFNPNYKKILRSVYGIEPFPEAKVIGDFIRDRTERRDQIALIGSEPEIYYYADRRVPSKHAYFSFLVEDNSRSREMQREFIRDLEKAIPKYLVFFQHPASLQLGQKADRAIFEWLNQFIGRNYKLVGLVDMISLDETRYVWSDEDPAYQRRGEFYIGIFERIEALR